MSNPVPSSVVVALPKRMVRIGDGPFIVVDSLPDEASSVPPTRAMVRGIALHGDEVLLVRQDLTGMWSIPGGGIEEGEEPAEAVAREMSEETGFSVRRATLAITLWERHGGGTYLTHAFLCEGEQDEGTSLTDEEAYLGQAPEWVVVRDAIARFARGLPDEAARWHDEDGVLDPDLEPVAEYLSYARNIYARDEMILRTLFPYG